jgi:hypothetical protein
MGEDKVVDEEPEQGEHPETHCIADTSGHEKRGPA